MLQELVVAPEEAATGLAQELLEHAESIMAARGADAVRMICLDEDRSLAGLLGGSGYTTSLRDFSVFMLAVVDLCGLLGRLAPALAERAASSRVEPPAGGLTLRSPNHCATVTFGPDGVAVAEGDGGDGGDGAEAVFELSEDVLVGLVTGTVGAEAAYLDGGGSMRVVSSGSLGARAVEFLGDLFPRLPKAAIRAHTW